MMNTKKNYESFLRLTSTSIKQNYINIKKTDYFCASLKNSLDDFG